MMKRLVLVLLVASLALTGCRTAHQKAEENDDFSISEMRATLVEQMKAAGATPAQIREMHRQMDLMERQVKDVQKQLNHMGNEYQ